MSSYSSENESSYYTESETESDFVWNEDVRPTHINHTVEVENFIRDHVDITTTNAIRLNHHYKAKLVLLRSELEILLSRCQTRLRDVEKNLEDTRQNVSQKFNHYRPRHPGYICGQPFFKDNELYPGPHNEDYLYRKNVRKEFFPLDMFETIDTVWTRRDKQALRINVWTQAIEFLQRECELRKKMCNNSTEAERIRNEKASLKTLPLEEIMCKAHAYDGQYGRQKFAVDWLKISNTIVHGRHTASACEGMWKNYLHPSLKRTMWSAEEESHLVAAAETYGCHRWDLIAQRVENRSEYQCFVHYQTNFSKLSQIKKMPWTDEEDKLLLRLVAEHRVGNNIIWNKIVERMPYRNKVQVYHRYKYTLLRPLKGTKFTAEEDCVITAYVQQYGDDFKFFPDDLLPGRTVKQVWSRYKNTLRFVNTHVGWTLDEDRRLMSYIAENLTEEGPQKISWANCSKYLGNHSRLSCRTRYYTIEKYLEKNPNATLETVPRREKKLSTNVTDQNWIKTIVDIKSTPKEEGMLRGPMAFLESCKPSAVEWVLYEQMKFCFRYKFGYRLRIPSMAHRVATGTKILLYLLEGYCGENALSEVGGSESALLHCVLQAPLDWPKLVSIMRPKTNLAGDSMLFCRIPPNYNTVLGLRGVCLNACCDPPKQSMLDHKTKKNFGFNKLLYDQAMAMFVERFRKIFHWTMLLMMLNIDDVTLEGDESSLNDIISVSDDGERNDTASCSGTARNARRAQAQFAGQPFVPVKLVKQRNTTTNLPTPLGIAGCSTGTFECPVVEFKTAEGLDIVNNITVIDPKDLPAAVVHTLNEHTAVDLGDHCQYQQYSSGSLVVVEDAPLDPSITQEVAKRITYHDTGSAALNTAVVQHDSTRIQECGLSSSNPGSHGANSNSVLQNMILSVVEIPAQISVGQQRGSGAPRISPCSTNSFKSNVSYEAHDENQSPRSLMTVENDNQVRSHQEGYIIQGIIQSEAIPLEHEAGYDLGEATMTSGSTGQHSPESTLPHKQECNDDAQTVYNNQAQMQWTSENAASSFGDDVQEEEGCVQGHESFLEFEAEEVRIDKRDSDSNDGLLLPVTKTEPYDELLTEIDESYTAVDIIEMLRIKRQEKQEECSAESDHD